MKEAAQGRGQRAAGWAGPGELINAPCHPHLRLFQLNPGGGAGGDWLGGSDLFLLPWLRTAPRFTWHPFSPKTLQGKGPLPTLSCLEEASA